MTRKLLITLAILLTLLAGCELAGRYMRGERPFEREERRVQ